MLRRRGPARLLARLRIPANALAAVLGAGLGLMGASAPALSQVELACPGLPVRNPMPREAKPENIVEPYWRARTAELTRVAGRGMGWAQTIFLGDSITQFWDPPVWEANFGSRGAANFGVGGDFTQGVLWRLQEGGQWPATLRPKVAVLLIGTNNSTYANPPEDTALGIAEIIRVIRRRSPTTRILLLGVLPRGADPFDPARVLNQRVNSLIAPCADNRSVFFADLGSVLIDSMGRPLPGVFTDGLHLTPDGYARLTTVLEPRVTALLGR
ncbi:GDSL-type esterase/lipase family protein [Roseomonas populi]|uniref:GDSL-type esterase/lipase family protein n=1 Tax=Roseomonas populi TaxID=3121582 RepID=A0ABT1X318_9PROT|nr:GDSL-type esterase/lipase family protein [Roseomonas pecuniae]MCR0982467.1 GDSL-type esterase/lipase family protein [Roseomonas pecuniae]